MNPSSVHRCRVSEVPLKDLSSTSVHPLRRQLKVMSLASRLQKIQEVKKPELPNIDHYTMEELGAMVIDFGNTHKGRSFQHMWEMEQEWVLWFVQHYSKSTKLNHRLVRKYIELKVELSETWNHKVPVHVPDQSGSDLRECRDCQLHPTTQEQDDGSQSKEPSSGKLCASDRHGGAGRARDASRVGTAATSRRPDGDHDSSRCSEFARSDGRNGEHASTSVGSSAAEGSRSQFREAVDVMEDSTLIWNSLLAAGDPDAEECLINTDNSKLSPDRQRFVQTLLKLEKEYLRICEQFQTPQHRSSKRVDLFEVFCSSKSRLTQQVIGLGGQAHRYFKEQTDLMTAEGRAVLFQDLLERDPEHVWFSPECGPWSAWSNLNQSKSLHCWTNIQNKRWDNLEQLALGVLLLRHQRARGKHFHWEQPS